MDDRIAWHFTSDTLRDGSPIPAVGETLRFDGEIRLCERGYHWSLKPHQALGYAPGHLLHMVRYGGEVLTGDDKGASSERTILTTIDAETLMRRFAADQALSVAHLWDMPKIVREYLTTLDETKRAAAKGSVWANTYAAQDAVVADAAEAAAVWAAAWAETAARYDPSHLLHAAARASARAEFDRRVYAAFGVSDNGK